MELSRFVTTKIGVSKQDLFDFKDLENGPTFAC